MHTVEFSQNCLQIILHRAIRKTYYNYYRCENTICYKNYYKINIENRN